MYQKNRKQGYDFHTVELSVLVWNRTRVLVSFLGGFSLDEESHRCAILG